jgi:D-galactarolactone isomerase
MKPPRYAAPAGACDTHMHFYDTDVPSAPGGPPLPGRFTVPMYRAVQSRLGTTRVVAVQPNAYQTDNSVLLSALQVLGADARGVVYLGPSVTEREIAQLTAAGVVAHRIFALPNGAVGFDRMDEVMARVHSFGWHANLQLDGRELPKYEAQIKRLPGRFVIDHVGKFLEPVTPEHESFRSLLRLLDTGRCWVKLSAPYEVSRTGPPNYDDVARLAKVLVAHAPERMLWASNWPHPSAAPGQMPDDADLLDLLLAWAPDDATRARILVDNPAELYGFR